MTVREPFAYGAARRYPLAPIVGDAGAKLLSDALAWVDPAGQIVHTEAGEEIAYDALVLALGAKAIPLYRHTNRPEDLYLCQQGPHFLLWTTTGGLGEIRRRLGLSG